MADNSPTETGVTLEKLFIPIGFVLAIIGLANSMPSFGFLPDLGVYPPAILHPVIYAFGLVISVLWLIRLEKTGARMAENAAYVGLLVIGLYALYRYNIDVTELDESGLFLFEEVHAWVTVSGCIVITILCWRIWGLPLAAVGGVSLLYFFTGEYWPGILGHAGMDFIEDTPNELWFNTGDGVLGALLGILINTIFPFIILGAVLEGTGGGHSLIKLSFHAMRKFRGGPAHAAIMASSLFGTISGSAVANVVGTGVITIPMIKKRGFRPEFAGGVEATASTGGQIMPPIMGAAALVMADFLGIDYLIIIIAAIVPALAYYASLFATVMFEARRLGVEASEDEDVDPIVPQDWINLILVVVPIATVIIALVRGASPAGSAILALLMLLVLSFLNPEIRRRPVKVLRSLANGGVSFGRLLMAIGVVGMIVSILGATGLPLEFAKVIAATTGENLVFTLVLAAIASLALGMGMPTLPAYLTIVIILGPSLLTLGLKDLTAHFFVFYYGVASAITPPVAIAAYAAASISGGGAIATAVQASRIGLVIFAIPFLFAFNPIMLIVPEAGGVWNTADFVYVIVRLCLLVYLLASAAVAFDGQRLPVWEIVLRILVGATLIHPDFAYSATALVVGVAIIAQHHLIGRRRLAT